MQNVDGQSAENKELSPGSCIESLQQVRHRCAGTGRDRTEAFALSQQVVNYFLQHHCFPRTNYYLCAPRPIPLVLDTPFCRVMVIPTCLIRRAIMVQEFRHVWLSENSIIVMDRHGRH